MSRDDPRGIEDRGLEEDGTRPVPKDEARSDDVLATFGRAAVRSIAPSGREVYDPERRTLDRGLDLDLDGIGTRRTGAGGERSVDIDLPLLGYTEHRSPGSATAPRPRTGTLLRVEPDPYRRVRALEPEQRRRLALKQVEQIETAMNGMAEAFSAEIGSQYGEDRVLYGNRYRNALKGFAETLNAIVHPAVYAWMIRHPSVTDPDEAFYLHPPPELPPDPANPNPNHLAYEGKGYTVGFDRAVVVATDLGLFERDKRWLMERYGWRTLKRGMIALIKRYDSEWTASTRSVSIGWPGVRTHPLD